MTHAAPTPAAVTQATTPAAVTQAITQDVRKNQDGAIMVIGLFMAIVLLGLLFYIAGVGQAVFRRERMQDAADAVALATAIGHARGMNVIVFINLIMAALVAILLALKIIELLLTALVVILAAISWLVPPAAAAIPVVNNFRELMHNIHEEAREIVDKILEGLNIAENAIRVITPAQATFTQAARVTSEYSSVVEYAVAVPPRLTLPVEDDEYNRLCKEGGDMLDQLLGKATKGVPFIGKVISMAFGLINKVAQAFCYRTAEPPDVAPVKITRNLYQSAKGRACEVDQSNMVMPSSNCSAWEREVLIRHPEDDGNCPRDPGGPNPDGEPFDGAAQSSAANSPDSERRALCEPAVAGARVDCAPTRRPRAYNYSWSEQEVEEHVEFDTKTWTWVTKSFAYLGEPNFQNTSTFSDANRDFMDAQGQAVPVDTENPAASTGYFNGVEAAHDSKPFRGKPCDNGGRYINDERFTTAADLWSPWSAQVYWEEFPGVTKPVCSRRDLAFQTLPNGGVPPEDVYGDRRLPQGFAEEGYTIKYAAVKHVYGCAEDAELELHFPEEWTSGPPGDTGKDKAPQKIEEGVTLGSSHFQIRGLAIKWGDRTPSKIATGLRNGAFSRQVEPESWVGPALALGSVVVAQAEYYFDHKGEIKVDDWMWTMDWRARLVRFRISTEEEEEDQKPQQKEFSPGDMDLSSLVTAGAADALDIDISDALSNFDLPTDKLDLKAIDEIIVH